jgi:predicted small lipoprotein YifL
MKKTDIRKISLFPYLFIALFLGLYLCVTGCGQKGPLYLPKTAPSQANTPQTNTPSGALPRENSSTNSINSIKNPNPLAPSSLIKAGS